MESSISNGRNTVLKNLVRAVLTSLVSVLALHLSWACASEAPDLTLKCEFDVFSGKQSFSQCLDGDYRTYWSTNKGGSDALLEIRVPEGQHASGIWMQWYDQPHAWSVWVQDQEGTWQEHSHTDGAYLSEFLTLPENTTAFRLANAPGERKRFYLADMHIYGEGELPANVQRWNPPAEKADLMLVAAHPDDEVLWFGGTLPRYAGEEQRICQVCTLVPAIPCRRLELLDSLWTCGVRNYPVWGMCRDAYSSTLQDQYRAWDKYRIYDIFTGWIRRFKPDVLLTHDRFGEYGHGAHQVCADAVMHALDLAMDPGKYKNSFEEYGLWEVPKTYLHLYPENSIRMDWRQPLKAFDGKTGFEVAEEAFQCHASQLRGNYRVEDSGRTDCSLFGLYRTTVGPDREKNDFFEHIPEK